MKIGESTASQLQIVQICKKKNSQCDQKKRPSLVAMGQFVSAWVNMDKEVVKRLKYIYIFFVIKKGPLL